MNAPLILLVFVVALGWIALLLRLANTGKPAIDHGNNYTLRHSALLRWFAIIALFGGQALLWLEIMIVPAADETMRWWYAAGVGVLGVTGFLLLWESYRWQLTVTPTHLDCRSPWKPRRVMARELVKTVRYERFNAWYVIEFETGSFRVPAVVPGVTRFAADFLHSPPFKGGVGGGS